MQPSHIDEDTAIHQILQLDAPQSPEITNSPPADDLNALWLDLGGSD
jgi:hypothetical protein